MNIPKVFISYSHDSQDHKKWVLDLATRLRNSGVDATLDQWDLQAGSDLPHFMETNLATSDYVIMVCTDKYVSKANAGKGGVGYEKMIVTSELLGQIDSKKVIPIIKQEGTRNVPTFLKTKMFIDFSIDDAFEYGFDELIRTVHESPLFVKPKIGNNPFEHVGDIKPQKTNDALRALMQLVVDDYENGKNYSEYFDLHRRTGISRIMFDMLLEEAVELNYVQSDRRNELVILREQGKFYAIQNKLVK